MKVSRLQIEPARLATQVSGLAMDIVGPHVKLEVRISGTEQLMSELADLRLALLLAAGRRDDGSLADGVLALAGERASGSSLQVEAPATALDINTLALRLTRLAAGLADSGEARQRWAAACASFLDARERAEAWYPGSWLITLADPASHLAADVLAAGLVSERAYLALESTLAMPLRLALAQKRFGFGCLAAGSNAFGEPVLLGRLAAAVPPWIDSFEPDLVERFPRLRALQEQGIEGFGHLASMAPEEIQSCIRTSPAVQRTLLLQLKDRLPGLARTLLWQELAGMPLGGEDPVALTDFNNFRALIAWFLGQLDDPDLRQAQQILAARIGESTIAPCQTLEALAAGLPDALPNTSSGGRERARRLQADAVRYLRRMPRSAELVEQIDAAIRERLAETGRALSLGPECPIPALSGSEPAAVERFLNLFFRDRRLAVYQRSEDGGGIVLFAADSDKDSVLGKLVHLLRERRLPAERERSQLEPEFEALIQRYPEVTRDVIQRDFLALLNWSDDPARPEARVVSIGRTAAAVVVAVLAQAGRPLERSDIAAAAAGPPLEVKLPSTTMANTLAALTADPTNGETPDVFEAVFQLGHGLYAGHAALPLTIEAQQPLVERVVQRVRAGRRSIRHHERLGDAYQWHCTDLLAELEAAGDSGDLESVEPARRWYLLDAILRYHRPKGLVNLQKGYWMEQVASLHPEAHEKIDQNDVVEWVLKTHGNGRPMQIGEVRELVSQVQSLGATGQLQVASRIPPGSHIDKSAGRGMLALGH